VSGPAAGAAAPDLDDTGLAGLAGFPEPPELQAASSVISSAKPTVAAGTRRDTMANIRLSSD
jgi:hypothetical protein